MKSLFVAVAALAMTACSVSPDAGQEAVLIKKPMFLGHGGIDPNPVRTGRSYVAPTTDWVMVNTQPQQYNVEFDDLMSKDGIPLHFNASIRLQVTDSVRLIRQFGPKWYDNNVEVEMSNRVRQAVRKHGMNETAIDTTAIDAIDDEVSRAMSQYIARTNLPIKLIKITVGKANPPDAIKNQRIRTAEEQQRLLTEQQSQKAEEARLGAERARALADNAYRQNMNLTGNEFVELQRIRMMGETCTRTKACTFVVGGTPISLTR